MKQTSKLDEVSRLEGLLDPQTEFLRSVEAVNHNFLPAFGVLLLLRQDLLALSRIPGVEQKKALFQILKGVARNLQSTHRNVTVAVHFKAVEATPNRDVLVLLPNGVSREINLNMAGLLCKLPFGLVVALEGVERHQQSHEIAPRATHSCAGRHISHRGYLEIAREVELLQ